MDATALFSFGLPPGYRAIASRPPGSELSRQKHFESLLDTMTVDLAECGWASLDARTWLTPQLLAELQAEVTALHEADALAVAGVGRGLGHTHDKSVRRDRIAWLKGESAPQKAVFECLEGVRRGLNERAFLGLRRFEAHYATYEAGDFYRRHVDSFRGKASRVVSLVLYLNEGWQAQDGGVLQIYNRETPNELCGTVLPEAGRMVVFMSEEIPHEVITAQRTRYSLACWFRCDEVPFPMGIDAAGPAC